MAEDFNFEYNDDGRDDNQEALKGWIPTLIMLFCFFPVGFVMLIFKLFGLSGARRPGSAARHPYDIQRQRARQAGQQAGQEARTQAEAARQKAQSAAQQARAAAQSAQKPPKKKKTYKKAPRKQTEAGQSLIAGGGITAAIAGFVSFASFMDLMSWGGWSSVLSYGLEEVFFPLGICGAGLVMLYYGLQKRKRSRRFRKYLALIGKRESISVVSLAQAMGVSVHRACDDLQDMLDEGVIPVGFLDMGSGRLILNDEGLNEEPVYEPEPARPAPEPEVPRGMEQEDEVLMEIRAVNDAIADEEMSRKIDRIGEITGKIFAYLREKPDKEGQLRSFLSYYLPTTLKILRAYAQMEAQGIEGENITAAKERIEGMMDKVVDGFEKQLDKLFQDDAMDITTDVAVLERMLDKDGLGGGQGMTLGC